MDLAVEDHSVEAEVEAQGVVDVDPETEEDPVADVDLVQEEEPLEEEAECNCNPEAIIPQTMEDEEATEDTNIVNRETEVRGIGARTMIASKIRLAIGALKMVTI